MSVGSDYYGDRVVLIGWGDESGSDAVRDPGTYVLSVVLADSDSTAEIQATMVEALREKGPKLRWRDLLPKRRMDVVQAMASLPAAGLVVVGHALIWPSAPRGVGASGAAAGAGEGQRGGCRVVRTMAARSSGVGRLVWTSAGSAWWAV